MPFPLSTLAIAALAVGGVASGVGTAAASASPAAPPSVVAALAQQRHLATDIAGLTETARHLEATLATALGRQRSHPRRHRDDDHGRAHI